MGEIVSMVKPIMVFTATLTLLIFLGAIVLTVAYVSMGLFGIAAIVFPWIPLLAWPIFTNDWHNVWRPLLTRSKET